MINHKRIIELQKYIKKHHPFCARNYIEAKLNGLEWICMCPFLNKYDIWNRLPCPKESWELQACQETQEIILKTPNGPKR